MGSGQQRRAVIVGGSFAGLAAAHTLRRLLPSTSPVTLVDRESSFLFAPSLIDYALGRTAKTPSFVLRKSLEPKGIRFVDGYVSHVDLDGRTIAVGEDVLPFDVLLIATGGRPDSQSVPGASGEWKHNHFILGQSSAQEVTNVLSELKENPGRIVVGMVPGATYFSAMYELALGLETWLRRSGVRAEHPITFVTPEPFLGDLGLGQTAARSALERLFRDHDIDVRTDCRISRIDREAVYLSSDESLPVTASFLMPAFTGSVDIWKSSGLTDDRGFVPVNHSYRHVDFANVFAAGVASTFTTPVPPLTTAQPPHTGYLSVRMGRTAATNMAAELGFGAHSERTLPRRLDVRVLEFGDSGLLLTSRGDTQLRHRAVRLPGPAARLMKTGSAKYLTQCLARGRVDWV